MEERKLQHVDSGIIYRVVHCSKCDYLSFEPHSLCPRGHWTVVGGMTGRQVLLHQSRWN